MAFEAYWDNVSVALRLNAQPFTCDKGSTVVSNGVGIGSYGATSGSNAAQFDAASDYITVSGADIVAFGTGSFSCAFSMTPSAVNDFYVAFSIGDKDFGNCITFGNFYDQLYMQVRTPQGMDNEFLGDAGSAAVGVTRDILITRDVDTLRVFADGAVLFAAPGYSTHTMGGNYPVIVGNRAGLVDGYRGGIDDVFVVKGVAVVTAPYTPGDLFDTASNNASVGIEIQVIAMGQATLPIEISTYATGIASCGISVNVLSAALISGTTTVADSLTGAARWSPVVELAGVDVTANVIGEINVEASEGAARIASFTLSVSGSIDLPGMVGQSVAIDIADSAGSNRLRLFSGVVDSPEIDLQAGTITIIATDDLMNTVNAMDRSALDALIGGRWSSAVFDPAAVPWSYAQDKLSTVPAALDMTAYGQVRVTPWSAKATPDLYFDNEIVLEGSVSVSTAERSGLINDMTVDFGYRFPMAKREAYRVIFSYLPGTFGQWLIAGNPFLLRSTVEDAVESAGFAVETIEWMALPTTIQEINAAGGVWWLPNQLYDPLVCLGFDGVFSFDYTQSVQEQHSIRVYSQASIDAVGRLPASMSGAIEGKTSDPVAAETNAVLYKAGITKIPGQLTAPTESGKTTAAVLPLTADTNRTAAEAALECLIDIAKARIAASHRSGRVFAAVALHPLIDLDKTITIEADGVLATGKVVALTHRMVAGEALAQTDFQIALTRLDGLGLAMPETATAAPQGVADGITSTLTAPVVTYNGQWNEDKVFTITFPEVTAAERNAKTVEISSEFNVPIVEDDLTIIL